MVRVRGQVSATWISMGVSLLLSFGLVSCASQLKMDRSAQIAGNTPVVSGKANLEFIGYKGNYDSLGSNNDAWQQFKQSTILRQLGSYLQKNNYVVDQSYAYLGFYSLQEIGQYKSKLRYVTFVEVERNDFIPTKKGGVLPQSLYGGMGALCVVAGIAGADGTDGATLVVGLLAGGGAAALAILNPPKTVIYFTGTYNIYIYDTLKKEIVYKDSLAVGPFRDQYKGSYSSSDEGVRKEVISYYATCVADALVKKYAEVAAYVRTLDP